MFALVGLVTLIACTNIGGMLLARGLVRSRGVDVARLVLREGLFVATLGATVGRPARSRAVPYSAASLFELSPVDPATLVATAILVVGASVAVCCVPALRAARIDPIAALRYD